jgi:DNA polymerase epsilon subunit 1
MCNVFNGHFRIDAPGTLCEALLMVEACTKSIICPNKQVDPIAKFTEKGNLLESETYIGGKVECLETGVYRSDIEYKFDMKPAGFQSLIDNVDRDMTFAIEVEGGIDRRKITNYDEVRSLCSCFSNFPSPFFFQRPLSWIL